MFVEKAGKKTRDIKFYSQKNNELVVVHSKEARAYTKYLESMENVISYVAGKIIDLTRLQMVSKVDIRGDYFKQQWESDFYIVFDDGTIAVRELAGKDTLEKRADIEKLELSRRYWNNVGVTDWKIVWMEEK